MRYQNYKSNPDFHIINTRKGVMEINSTARFIEGQLIRLEGNAFQDCMDRLGSELYPGDYQPVRPAGPKGDTKNDGYCPKARVFFAAHATRGESLGKSKSKIQQDLEGCLRLHRDVRTWRFLTNDTLPGEVDQFVDNFLRPRNPAVSIEIWGLKTLAKNIAQLTKSQIGRIVDINLDEPPRVRIVPDPNAPPIVELSHIKSGQDIWPLISESLAWIIDDRDNHSHDDEDLIDEAIQMITDCLEISADIEVSRAGIRSSQREITRLLNLLKEQKILIYAGAKSGIIEGGIWPPKPFETLIIRIVQRN